MSFLIRISERQRDALYSLLKPYSEGIATLKNSKGDHNCFQTVKGKLFSADECLELLKKLEEIQKRRGC